MSRLVICTLALTGLILFSPATAASDEDIRSLRELSQALLTAATKLNLELKTTNEQAISPTSVAAARQVRELAQQLKDVARRLKGRKADRAQGLAFQIPPPRPKPGGGVYRSPKSRDPNDPLMRDVQIDPEEARREALMRIKPNAAQILSLAEQIHLILKDNADLDGKKLAAIEKKAKKIVSLAEQIERSLQGRY